MKNKPLIHSLYDIGAIKFGDFTLKSGESSKVYLDLRVVVSYPLLLRQVADAIWETVTSVKFDLLCGVPYTALPIATCVSLDHSIPMIMRRKEKKNYGTKQQVEGAFCPGQRCLIIEDVVTSGTSVLETIDEIEAVALKVTDVAVLINREQGGQTHLAKRGYHLHSVFTLKQVMQELLHAHWLPQNEREIVLELLSEPLSK